MIEIEIAPLRGRATVGNVAALGHTMFSESRFAVLGFSVDKAIAYADKIVNDPLFVSIGAFEGESLVGMCVGICGNILPFSCSTVSTQHLFYILQEHRGGKTAYALVNAFIEESAKRGAKDVMFSNGTGYEPEKVDRLYKFCGLSPVGGVYCLEN